MGIRVKQVSNQIRYLVSHLCSVFMSVFGSGKLRVLTRDLFRVAKYSNNILIQVREAVVQCGAAWAGRAAGRADWSIAWVD